MKLVQSIFAVAILLVAGFSGTAGADELSVGDLAPNFVLSASDGNSYELAYFKDKRAVVIAWFPKAYTAGCTIECKSLADNGHLIRKHDVAYFMASVDSVEDNTGFARENRADFPLLSDPGGATAAAYGVLSNGGYAQRHTFYIGIDGRILKIDSLIVPETSAQDIAANLNALKIALINPGP
jgi:peroxiredoxin Q/BCP